MRLQSLCSELLEEAHIGAYAEQCPREHWISSGWDRLIPLTDSTVEFYVSCLIEDGTIARPAKLLGNDEVSH
jgi:hypothetical protein